MKLIKAREDTNSIAARDDEVSCFLSYPRLFKSAKTSTIIQMDIYIYIIYIYRERGRLGCAMVGSLITITSIRAN